jgi:16S rRNA processing protein RimM
VALTMEDDSNDSKPFGVFARRKVARVESPRGLEDQHDGAPDASGAAMTQPTGVAGDELIEVGVIVDAYGVRGWIKAVPHAQAGQGADILLRAPRWWLARPVAAGVRGAEDEPPRVVEVLQAKAHSGTVVAQFAGSVERDGAEAFKGCRVSVHRSDFPAPADGEFYWVDLIGLSVENESGDVLGSVVEMFDNGAHPIMRVTMPAADMAAGDEAAAERLIPFIGVYVKQVDQTARKIIVDWQLDY